MAGTIANKDKQTVDMAKLVEHLGSLGCSVQEIAQITGGNYRKIWRDHREAWERGHGDLVQKLRGAQIDKALVEKNAQMLIHLGKHYLQQSDHLLINANEDEEAVEEMDTADLISLVSQHKDD